jgi:hypothetical protein
VADPQVLAGVHIAAGFGSEQAYFGLGFLSSAIPGIAKERLAKKTSGSFIPAHRIKEER